MSLIIDSLKKLKKSPHNKPLPPNLQAEKKSNKKLFILTSIVVVLSIFFIILKILESKFIITKESKYTYTQLSQKEVTHKITVSDNQEEDVKNENIKHISQNNLATKENVNTPIGEKNKKPQEKSVAETPQKKEEKKRTKKEYVFYITRGNRYLKKKEYQKSLEFYQKAYKITPEETLLTNIIVLKIKLGKDNIKEEITHIKDTKNLYKVALSAINENKPYLIKDFLQKRSLSDNSGITHYLLGIIYEGEGDLKSAEKKYEKAFKQNPSNPYISYAYGRILEINGHYSLSRKIYEHTLEITKNKNTKLWKLVYERLKAFGGNHE